MPTGEVWLRLRRRRKAWGDTQAQDGELWVLGRTAAGGSRFKHAA